MKFDRIFYAAVFWMFLPNASDCSNNDEDHHQFKPFHSFLDDVPHTSSLIFPVDGTTYEEWYSAEVSPPEMKGVFYCLTRSPELSDRVAGAAKPCDYLIERGVKLVDHLQVNPIGM